MYSYAHFDGRCATLRPDDINGLNAVYPRAGTPLPTRTPTRAATPTPTPTPPATRPPTRRATSTPTRTRTSAPTSTPTPNSASGGLSNDTCLGAINVNAL